MNVKTISPEVVALQKEIEASEKNLQELTKTREALAQRLKQAEAESRSLTDEVAKSQADLSQQRQRLVVLQAELKLSSEIQEVKRIAAEVNELSGQLHSKVSELIAAIESRPDISQYISFTREGAMHGWKSTVDCLPVALVKEGSPVVRLAIAQDLKSDPGTYQEIAVRFQ